MEFLVIVFVSVLFLVVVAAWLVIRAIELTVHGVAWTVKGLIGTGNKHRYRSPDRSTARCANDSCNAAWRDEARFCHRCGRPRHALLDGPRPSREMTRVA